MRVSGGLAPFSPVFHWLLDLNPSPHAIALYAHLHRRADWSTGEADVSQTELAKALGFAKRDSVRPYLDELVQLGALEILEQRGETGAKLANAYVLSATPARSSGHTPAPLNGQAPARPSGQLPISPDASQTSSLPGLESDPEPKVIPARKPVRPDVERLAVEGARLFATVDEHARVDANVRRIAEQLLDERKATPEQVLGILRWALSDAFWGSKVLTWPKLREHYVALRKQASVTGPARTPASDAAAAGRPDPTRPGADPLENDDRRRAMLLLSRGVDPADWWRAGLDPTAALARVRSVPASWHGDVEELVMRWQNRDSMPWPALGWTATRRL